MGTHFKLYAGFRDGIFLLRQLHDTQNADAFQKTADEMKAGAEKYLLDASGSFGTRWQTNAYAVLSIWPIRRSMRRSGATHFQVWATSSTTRSSSRPITTTT